MEVLKDSSLVVKTSQKSGEMLKDFLNSINDSLRDIVSDSEQSAKYLSFAGHLTKLKEDLEKDSKSAVACYGIGFLHYCQGELSECLEYLNKAINMDSSNSLQKAVELRQKALRIIKAMREGE
jgi:tetratricopeptide (TPR) repeat protein